jgi:gamma-glutamyltranspeptidase/glutathione hydrolase
MPVAAALLLSAALGSAPSAEAATLATGASGMVVSSEEHASRVGLEILRAGGNAVDAAVGVAFALAVTYPQAGNLGGGGFLLYRSPDAHHHALDFREVAPRRLGPQRFVDEDGRVIPGLSLDSGLAVGVPGSVAGLAMAHERWGSKPWPRLLEPAIDLAEEGFPLSRREVEDLERHGARILRNPAARRVFTRDGRWPRAGELLVQPELAATLRRVAREGPRGFYRGPVARAIVRAVREAGGVMTLRDLASYRAVPREPLAGSYRGHTIVGFPPPSSGGVALLQALGMLERFDLRAAGPDSPRTIHRAAEAARRAFADRARWLGDPDHGPVPVEALLDPGYLAGRSATIRDDGATPSREILPGQPAPGEGTSTTHLSIGDPWGGAVALTTTLNAAYGSGLVAPGTGVLLNNEIDDFALAPGAPNAYGLVGGAANAVEGGKRPLSSMAPTIVEQPGGGARPLLVLGSPGGPRIITAVLQVLLHVIDHDLSLADAIARPRVHHQWQPDVLSYEPGSLGPEVVRSLAALGHHVVEVDDTLGEVNAIGLAPDGAWVGVADPRGGGRTLGF